jgi:hypothetical protein
MNTHRKTTSADEDVRAWFSDPRTASTQQANEDRWLRTLRQQAADDSDPETQANARLLLANR